MTEQEEPRWSRSFELVYYDPSTKFHGRTHFRDPENDPLTTEQRIAYLQAYAELLKRENGLGERYLSSEIVGEDEAEQLASQIKAKPLPRNREIVPLRFWRWKLQGAEEDEWVASDFDDSLWNELETPTVLDMGRAMLLRSREHIESSERVVLDIESIHDEYDLWVNGESVAHHEGYEPHQVDITDVIRPGQENTFAICVAKKPGHQIGIAGSIQVVGTHSVYIEDLFVKPVEAMEGRPARVQIITTVRNAGGKAFSGRLAARFYRWFPEEDAAVAYEAPSMEVKVGPGQAVELSQDCVWAGAELWWPERPHLYKVEAVVTSEHGEQVDDYVDTVGIRTIQQREGRIYLNGKRFVLRSFGDNLGFAPSADSHSSVCPPDGWIVRDFLLAKRANANGVRVHPWGYGERPGEYNELGFPEWGDHTDGTSYVRIAEIADQIGLCLIWVTRLWTLGASEFRKHYDEQQMERLLPACIKQVRNHPSIISHEGLNGVGATMTRGALGVLMGSAEETWLRNLSPQEVKTLNRLHERRYEEFCAKFIQLVNSADGSRLVCPDSHWSPGYQGEPHQVTTFALWDTDVEDESAFTLTENLYWALHEYPGWYRDFQEMYARKDRIIPHDRARPVIWTEFAAEAMPDWERYRGLPWRNMWINHDTPSAAIEKERLGRPLRALRNSEADLSQAYQGLFFQQVSTFGRVVGCDGMNFQLITDGLSQGMYHKGVCDLYRRAKLGYFAARMAYQPTLVTGMDGDFVFSEDDALHLVLLNDAVKRIGERVKVQVRVRHPEGGLVDSTDLDASLDGSGIVQLGDYRPRFPTAGLYQIEYTVVPAQG